LVRLTHSQLEGEGIGRERGMKGSPRYVKYGAPRLPAPIVHAPLRVQISVNGPVELKAAGGAVVSAWRWDGLKEGEGQGRC
jgi:hypothetical protein